MDPNPKLYAGKREDAKGGRHYAPPSVWKKALERVGADGIAASWNANLTRERKKFCRKIS